MTLEILLLDSIPQAVVWSISLNIDARAFLFPHNVIFVSHQDCVVTWIRKLLPIIHVMHFQLAFIESLSFV